MVNIKWHWGTNAPTSIKMSHPFSIGSQQNLAGCSDDDRLYTSFGKTTFGSVILKCATFHSHQTTSAGAQPKVQFAILKDKPDGVARETILNRIANYGSIRPNAINAIRV